ncbi:hypothetical protein B0J13DRAFT_531482 [Dactylonectria estremocensis]|uniref:Nephrocystin 3-like N-terminal domain-containing protein n=1 Tax=Dactylonectria estremocensis TaxID=1079267 RepID=A0A9P9IL56_9HYPO|nr:hypothetical protein B0J13DRAFT_531482 [Dactylonectria estremocensis]
MVGPSGRAAVHSAGMTILVNPDQPSLDGHDDEPDEPPSKARKLGFLSRPHQPKNGDTASCFWPQELLPEILPNARVLTYGYDTKIQHVTHRPVSTATIYDIAWDFLVALQAECQDDPSRPILFIAHSLGGIVVKEMLRRSSGCLSAQTHLHGIFRTTIGIVFFGTPHGGANPHGFLVHIAKKFFKAIGYEANESIINALLPNSERLRELTDCFGTMAEQRKWIIHSFQELDRVKLLRQKVVEDEASRLNIPAIEVTEHICDDHMGMSKFADINDPEFKKVAAALRRITYSQSESFGQSKRQSLTEEQKKILRDSLDFDELQTRHASIKNAHVMTCKWILEKSQYVNWLDPMQLVQHNGFLWIKGKPGAGKSTLMKYVLENARRTMRSKFIIQFFFNAPGHDLERSTIGMYRSLLLQMLNQLPGLWDVLDSLNSTVSGRGCPDWNLELLKSTFEDAIQHLGTSSLVCFIDALDECDESQIRDMISSWEYLGGLAVNKRLKFLVCFSSRHYPHITMKNGLSLTLERQEGHDEDIIKYVDSELKIGKTRLAEKVRMELQKKAAGVFMWVVLVVRILNKEHDSGRIHLLRQRLKDIPEDLHELFRDILIRDVQNKNELLLCIQWVLYSRAPLNPEELYFAIMSAAGPGDALKWNRDELSGDDIRRYILHCSKGLAEVTHSERPTIQFIHESVRDFLLKDNGLNSLWPDVGDRIESRSYEQLKQSCLRYIRADVCNEIRLNVNVHAPSDLDPPASRTLVVTSFPFLEHAVHNVLYYADKAAGCGVPQEDFLKDFSNYPHLQHWIALSNLFERYERPQYTLKASLLYILAMAGTPSLIGSHHSIIACLDVENEYYGCALLATIAWRKYQAFRQFMQRFIEILPPNIAARLQASQDVESGFKPSHLDYNFKFPHGESVLSHFSRYNDGALFSAVLEIGKFAVDFRELNGRTPLSYAAAGSTEVIKVLLATNKVDVDSKDNKGPSKTSGGHTPFLLSVWGGNEDIVALLLQNETVDVKSADQAGRTPLWWAVELRRKDIVDLLVNTGKFGHRVEIHR